MGYRSKYNRRLRAAKRLQKRLALAALLAVTVSAAAFMTLRETLPTASGAYVQADGAPGQPAPRTVAAVAAPAAHAGARPVYPFSIVPGGVAGREEVVHVLQTDQVVAQHYAGLQVARLGAVTVSKPRAVYVSYRKGDKVYWTAQKVMLAQGETLLSDGSNEIRGRCGNRISDVPRLPVEAKGPTMAMLDAADLDADADADDGGERQASNASSNGADGAPGAGQPVYLASTEYGGGMAPSYARPPALLAMSGIGGGAPSFQSPKLAAAPAMAVSTQASVASDSSVSSGTPGTPGTRGATTGGMSGSGTGTDSGTSGGDAGAPGTGGGSGGTGGTSDTPPKTTLFPGGDPADDTTGVDMPPLPHSLSEPDALPVIVPKAPARSNQVPEPDTLWLSGAALAAILLARRAPRRPRRG